MLETDKLYPELLTAQAEEIYKKLTNDNYNLDLVSDHMNAFISCADLKGEAYDSARKQFADYKLIFQEIKNSNTAMMADCYTLVSAIGTEIYDGPEIFAQQRQAMKDKEAAEAEARNWRSKITEDTWGVVAWYYELRASWCDDDAQECQDLWDYLEGRKKEFDDINAATKGLFDCSTDRSYQRSILRSIILAFSGGKYDLDTNQQWRVGLRNKYKNMPAEWDPQVESDLKNLGMTDAEIEQLKHNGVVLTADDVNTIKNSKGKEEAVFSANQSSVIYNGKVYYINVPSYDEVTIGSQWNTVAVKQGTQTEFDLCSAITGFEMEGPEDSDGEVRDRAYNKLQSSDASALRSSWQVAGGLFAMTGILSFIDNGTSSTNMRMAFENNGTVGRVTIAVGTEAMTERLENANYYGDINSYKIQEGVRAKQMASGEAAYMYTLLTGIDTDDDKNYTLISTLDERHKGSQYQGVLYYDNGQLMCKPIVYSGDTGYIATCDSVTGNHPQKILDCTEYLDTPVAASEYESLLNTTLGN